MKIKIDNRYIVESADKNISRDRFVDSVKKMSKVIEKVSNKDDVFEAEEDISNKYGTESIKRGDTVTGFQTKDGKKYIYLGIANRVPGDRRSDLAYPGVFMNKDTKEEIYVDSDIEDKLYSGDIKIDEVLSNKLYQTPEEWKRNYKPLLAKKEVKKEEVKEEKVEDAKKRGRPSKVKVVKDSKKLTKDSATRVNTSVNMDLLDYLNSTYGTYVPYNILKIYKDVKKANKVEDFDQLIYEKYTNDGYITEKDLIDELTYDKDFIYGELEIPYEEDFKDSKKRIRVIKKVKDSKKSVKDILVKIGQYLDEFQPSSTTAKYVWGRINEEDKLDDLDALLTYDYGYGDSIDDEELNDLLEDNGRRILNELGIEYDADNEEDWKKEVKQKIEERLKEYGDDDDFEPDYSEFDYNEEDFKDSCTKDNDKAFRFDINKNGKKYVVKVNEAYDKDLDEPIHYVFIKNTNGEELASYEIYGRKNAEQAAYYAIDLYEKKKDDSVKKKTNVADIPYNAPEKKSEFTYRKAVKGGSSAPTLASLKYAVEHDHDKERAELILRDIVKSSDEDVANPGKLKSVLGTPERKQLINEYAEAEDIARKLNLTDLADRLKENITKLGKELKTGEWELSFTNVPEEEIYRAGLKARKLYGKDSEYSSGYDVQFLITPTKFNIDLVDYLNGVENNTFKSSIRNVKMDARADYNRILEAEEDGDKDPYLDMYPTSVLKKIVKHYDNALAKLQNIKNEDGSLVFAKDVEELSDYVETIHKAWGI